MEGAEAVIRAAAASMSATAFVWLVHRVWRLSCEAGRIERCICSLLAPNYIIGPSGALIDLDQEAVELPPVPPVRALSLAVHFKGSYVSREEKRCAGRR